MAYENYVKQTFVDYPDADATVLKKEHLDHIEDGIVALEGQAAQIESDVTLIKQSGAPSVSAKRFEAGENANISALDPRGGVEVTISTMEFKEDGSVEATYASEYVFDGYDGAPGAAGLSVYPFDPGSADLSGSVKLADVTITRPDGRYLQVGDFLLTAAGEMYRVTSMTVDGGTITVEEFTTVGGSGGSGGVEGVYWVTVTGESDTDGQATIDRTFAEIKAAHDAGMACFMRVPLSIVWGLPESYGSGAMIAPMVEIIDIPTKNLYGAFFETLLHGFDTVFAYTEQDGVGVCEFYGDEVPTMNAVNEAIASAITTTLSTEV